MTNKAVSNRSLYGMFTTIPPRYDLINRIITLCSDERWRREAARTCLVQLPVRILDLGCGTGDLALNLARLANGATEIVGIDFSQPMLEIAAEKARSLAGGNKVSFVNGDAANLPFPDRYFNAVGISFAFRNLTYRNPLAQRHLSEVARVLDTGGRFVIVETSQPTSKLIRWLYRLYLRWLVFPVGYWLSGNRGAYRYLTESAYRFYTAQEVKNMLLAVGFSEVLFKPLFFGAIGIHVAIK